MTRNEGEVGIFKLEFGVAEHACRAHLDDPDPEILAANGCSVEIHENGVERIFGLYGVNGIVNRIGNCGFDTCESVASERNELDLFVARCDNAVNSVFACYELAVFCCFKKMKTALGTDDSEVGDVYGFVKKHRDFLSKIKFKLL